MSRDTSLGRASTRTLKLKELVWIPSSAVITTETVFNPVTRFKEPDTTDEAATSFVTTSTTTPVVSGATSTTCPAEIKVPFTLTDPSEASLENPAVWLVT